VAPATLAVREPLRASYGLAQTQAVDSNAIMNSGLEALPMNILFPSSLASFIVQAR
jgi:hypothetical protein